MCVKETLCWEGVVPFFCFGWWRFCLWAVSLRMSDEGGRVVLTKEDIESDDDGDNVPKEERLDSEGSDSELPYVKDDEELDDPSLQFMNMTVEDKVEMATKEKEAGNVLFREKEYEKAWKQYDKAFVNVFVGKEEWAELSEDQKSFLNAFKAPCHLNRGFCRLKLGQVSLPFPSVPVVSSSKGTNAADSCFFSFPFGLLRSNAISCSMETRCGTFPKLFVLIP